MPPAGNSYIRESDGRGTNCTYDPLESGDINKRLETGCQHRIGNEKEFALARMSGVVRLTCLTGSGSPNNGTNEFLLLVKGNST